MIAAKSEILAFRIRKQIAYLEGLLKELESVRNLSDEWKMRVHDVEDQLRQLRASLSS